jgi:hypothetical protein
MAMMNPEFNDGNAAATVSYVRPRNLPNRCHIAYLGNGKWKRKEETERGNGKRKRKVETEIAAVLINIPQYYICIAVPVMIAIPTVGALSADTLKAKNAPGKLTQARIAAGDNCVFDNTLCSGKMINAGFLMVRIFAVAPLPYRHRAYR